MLFQCILFVCWFHFLTTCRTSCLDRIVTELCAPRRPSAGRAAEAAAAGTCVHLGLWPCRSGARSPCAQRGAGGGRSVPQKPGEPAFLQRCCRLRAGVSQQRQFFRLREIKATLYTWGHCLLLLNESPRHTANHGPRVHDCWLISWDTVLLSQSVHRNKSRLIVSTDSKSGSQPTLQGFCRHSQAFW